jgi:hypothetical protein
VRPFRGTRPRDTSSTIMITRSAVWRPRQRP